MMQAVNSFATLVNIYQTTWSYILEYSHFNTHHGKNIKSPANIPQGKISDSYSNEYKDGRLLICCTM
jgi:hypothetical protein